MDFVKFYIWFHKNFFLNFRFHQILYLLSHKLFIQFQISSNSILAFTKTLSSIFYFIKIKICFHKNSFLNFGFRQILHLLSQKLSPQFWTSPNYTFAFTQTLLNFRFHQILYLLSHFLDIFISSNLDSSISDFIKF